jgi:hypothetical protein
MAEMYWTFGCVLAVAIIPIVAIVLAYREGQK